MAGGDVLEVENLRVEFKTRGGIVPVIGGLSFSLGAGETLGIVGESGCGKSMTALAILRLVPSPPGRIAEGAIRILGDDILTLDEERVRALRGNVVSMVFQEPMSSLNPVFTVGEQIAETVRLHAGLDDRRALTRAIEMLRAVGIPAPERRVREYPHQLSGGMRQRVMIAMALVCEPALLICDEPTTALDVTVQAQVLDLLRELQQRTGTAIILITHDMGVVAEMADRILVMYAGRKLEEGRTREILDAAVHPYTQGLIACVPHLEAEPGPERPPLVEIPGMVPSLAEVGEGCPFAPRCSRAEARCGEAMPGLSRFGSAHQAACWVAAREAGR